MVGYEEALEIILDSINKPATARVPIQEALNLILAEDVTAGVSLPPFDNSAMDGYAIVGSVVLGASRENPAVLRFVGDVAAGGEDLMEIHRGEAARIGTGAKIPRGADTVVMVEDTEFKNGKVFIFKEYPVGKNIRVRGEDFSEGEVVLSTGATVRPQEICFLAANGMIEVSVYRRPKVGVLSTGSELVPPGESLSGTEVRDSNGVTICSLVGKYGGEAEYLGIIGDDEDKLTSFFQNHAHKYDFLITSGGISKGYHDNVRGALSGAGAKMQFWATAIRPGKPFGFGRLGKTMLFNLPGNPVSSFVTFEVFCQPALKKAMGGASPYREYLDAVVAEDFPKKKGLTYFVRGNLAGDSTGYRFMPFTKQGSGMISSMVRTDAIMIVPAGREKLDAGEEVKVFRV